MTTTSGPRPSGPARPEPAGTAEDEAARIMAGVTRPVAFLAGPAGAALQLLGAVMMTAAGAGLLLITVPGALTEATAFGCLAVILARILLPLAGRAGAARRPVPAWTAAASLLETSHPDVLPSATLEAARRWVPAMAAAMRQPRAWLYVAPCDGTRARLCRGAATLPVGGRLLVILGARAAADPAAPFLLAHEAGHLTGWTHRVLGVIQGARAAGGWGWAAAGAAGLALGGWPGVLAAAAIFQVSSILAAWAVEIACDRRAARAEGPGAARSTWDYMRAARAAERAPGRARRVALAALDWAAGPSHPPLALRRALTARRS